MSTSDMGNSSSLGWGGKHGKKRILPVNRREETAPISGRRRGGKEPRRRKGWNWERADSGGAGIRKKEEGGKKGGREG